MSGHILVCGSGHLIHPFIRQLVLPRLPPPVRRMRLGTLFFVFSGARLHRCGEERLFHLYIPTIAVHGLPRRHIVTSACSCYHVTIAIEDVE